MTGCTACRPVTCKPIRQMRNYKMCMQLQDVYDRIQSGVSCIAVTPDLLAINRTTYIEPMLLAFILSTMSGMGLAIVSLSTLYLHTGL